MSNLIRHIIVRGLVQGVGYRAFVADEAQARRIEGWVRNRRDGTVEAVLSGPAEMVDPMIESCRKGPWGSRVTGFDVRAGTADALALRRAGEDFSVLPTA
jgi:acylphosphatase